jgi:hypothetical protein
MMSHQISTMNASAEKHTIRNAQPENAGGFFVLSCRFLHAARPLSPFANFIIRLRICRQ